MALKLFYGTMTVQPPESNVLEGATFVEKARTAPKYRLYSLDGFPSLRPDDETGVSIDVQLWDVPDDVWEQIAASEPPAYHDVDIELEDGRRVPTMMASAEYVREKNGVDVSEHGSWAAYTAAREA